MADTPPYGGGVPLPNEYITKLRSDPAGSTSAIRQLGTRLSLRRKKKPAPIDGMPTHEIVASADEISYLSVSEAIGIWKDYYSEYRMTPAQVMETLGLLCAQAIGKGYPLTPGNSTTMLVICGNGDIGGIGLACARFLKFLGYEVTVYWPQPSNEPNMKGLFQQLEAFEIPSLSFLPENTELISRSYEFVVDAIYDFRYSPATETEPFTTVLHKMASFDSTIISIDVPSGWIQSGDTVLRDASARFYPECVISLMVPKECMRNFQGRYHFLCGRMLPQYLLTKYNIHMPKFYGSDFVIELITNDAVL